MGIAIVTKKIGMTSVFSDTGECVPVTLLDILDNVVLAHKTLDKHGYDAVLIGSDKVELKKLNKPDSGTFKALGLEEHGYKIIRESRLDKGNHKEDIANYPVGTVLGADFFSKGQIIDVSGKTIGKGFAGVMKRHNFRGLRASHGVSVSHRSHGSTGNRQDPGKVFKGKLMAGHMGHTNVTTHNVVVFGIDEDMRIVAVRGSVPGCDGSLVVVRKAVKVL